MSEQEPMATFEELMEQLRQQVAVLEQDDLPLEASIAAYERSVELANACQKMLEEAELRIQKIDAQTRALQEVTAPYRYTEVDAARLLLGDDDDDLLDLLPDE